MKGRNLALLFVTVLLAAALAGGIQGRQALAQSSQRVGLVIKFSEGSVFTDCVDYTGQGMTGEDVLDASGLSVVKDTSYGAAGAAICKIEEEGCGPQGDCFCECTGEPPCLYWAYYHLDRQNGKWIWVYSGMGASGHSVVPGQVEGWAWGDGEYGGSDVKPPVMTFEEVCPPPTPPVVDLHAEPESIIAGQCSTIHWSVENAGAVTLNGEGVRPVDSRYVCLQQTQTFELQVYSDSGEYSHKVTVRVTQPSPTPPATATPTRAPTATRQPAAPPPTATRIPQAPAVLPSPTPTIVPGATFTSQPAVVAMAQSDTPTPAQEEANEAPSEMATTQPTATQGTPEADRGESVGLDRLLLLLGVGAGTLGFGAFAFVGMLIILLIVFLRARSQF